MKIEIIPATELDRYLDSKDTTILDIRPEREYARSHIINAYNVPYEKLEEADYRLPRDRGYVLYCERGGSSLLAAKELAERGYRVKSVSGGFLSYRGNMVSAPRGNPSTED